MPNDLKIDSMSMATVFVCVAISIGLVVSVFLASSGARLEHIVGLIVASVALGFMVWLVVVSDAYNRRRRRHKLSSQRRSPWGELRTELPKPYGERLSGFLSDADVSSALPSTDILEPAFQSKMPFWCLRDWRRDEPAELKPVWFIRRILARIRQAVRGNQPDNGV